jgi:DHA1 family bicyclomycin/chloramphenicol resistance-like MFS transporter
VVGLACGQLLAGPVSDALGRRRPLLVGVGCWTVAALACAAAPTISALVVLRLLQGLGGGAGIAVARAVVRDLFDTGAAARVFSLLLLVMAMAPVLAPLIGGQLMHVTDWRGLFVALAGVGCALLAAPCRGSTRR